MESAKGALCDVSSTILDIMGLEIPKEMTGLSLLKKWIYNIYLLKIFIIIDTVIYKKNSF